MRPRKNSFELCPSLRCAIWISMIVLVFSVQGAAMAAEIANGNGGFEVNGFSESATFPDLDHSAGPGNVDSWTYFGAVTPLAVLARGGSNYNTSGGDYMLGLGSVPDLPNVALVATAYTLVTGLVVDQQYAIEFRFAPGYILGSGPGEFLFGSSIDATDSAQIRISLADGDIGLTSAFFSAIPTQYATPTPLAADWQTGELNFTAPATQLNLAIGTVPSPIGGSDDALRAFYFIDDVTIAVPEPSAAKSSLAGLAAVMALQLCRRASRRQRTTGSRWPTTRTSRSPPT